MYQVPVYQVYQEDQDQISGATYISDVVFFANNDVPLGKAFPMTRVVDQEQEVLNYSRAKLGEYQAVSLRKGLKNFKASQQH